MNKLTFRHFVLFLMFFSVSLAVCESQITGKRGQRNPEKRLFGKSINTKEKGIKESRGVIKAKKLQARKEEKLKKEYNNSVRDSKKRAFKIQTSEVQARMKQNQKDINAREKTKKKKNAAATKKAKRKYK